MANITHIVLFNLSRQKSEWIRFLEIIKKEKISLVVKLKKKKTLVIKFSHTFGESIKHHLESVAG